MLCDFTDSAQCVGVVQFRGHDCTGDPPEVGETSAVPINVNEEGSSRVSGSSFLQPWSACDECCGERQFLAFSAFENAR